MTVNKAFSLWFTGLPGAGKTTLAKALYKQLTQKNHPVVVLDGDQCRAGVCQKLGFSDEDRTENIRRVSEIAKLVNASGISCVAATISPHPKHRELARKIIGLSYIEVFVDCPLEICQSRDPKGHYKRAKLGTLTNFTGVNHPYIPPDTPHLTINTHNHTLDRCISSICHYLDRAGYFL